MKYPLELIALCFLPILVFGGYPISDPYDGLGVNGKIIPYNLIDTNPSCFWHGVCPMFPPGGELSAFPNSEEKFQHILHNQHRMFANQTLDTTLGYYLYGANDALRSKYCTGCSYCGSTHSSRVPLYWYSDANQMARFKQWDEKTCDSSWYAEPGNNKHVTCEWGTEETSTFRGSTYTTPSDRCSMMSEEPDCGFGARGTQFGQDSWDRPWFETEGICGGNSCLKDSHCEPIFANKYDYVGKGFVAGMNGAAAVYSRFTKEIWYLLPIAAHFDERMRVPESFYNVENKHFVLMLEYHDANKTQTPEACYALYGDQITNMPVWLSTDSLDGWNEYHAEPGWYSRNSFSVMFKAHFLPPSSCQPYAFICKTSKGNLFRLPEDPDYYFGTEWIDWSWSNYDGKWGLHCKENHYYHHSTEGWTVNGGPTLTESDIWYYQDTINYGTCIGCQYIDVLDCLSQCIYNNDVTAVCESSCSGVTAAPSTSTDHPTETPTPAPTVQPTENATPTPTYHPTHVISTEPTKTPTSIPTTQPSSSPISTPTDHPTSPPTSTPTDKPTSTPTDIPTSVPSNQPSSRPTDKPSLTPTDFPTSTPTDKLTSIPTSSTPTSIPTDKPSSTPTDIPTSLTPTPTSTPTDKPSSTPTNLPSSSPISTPTDQPIPQPTSTPTPATTQPTLTPTDHPIPTPTSTPTNQPSATPTDIPTSTPTNKPTSSPTHQPTSSSTPTNQPTSTPTDQPSPIPTDKPTSTPTATTSSPSSSPTQTPIAITTSAAFNCDSVIDYTDHFRQVFSWNETKDAPDRLILAQQRFINTYPNCGDAAADSLEFFYRFNWISNNHKLNVWMHVCCGEGATFGSGYSMDGYKPNAAYIDKYGENNTALAEKNEWTDPQQFGIKQYIVFSIIGLMMIGCCFGIIYYKSDTNKRPLAKSIEMHGLSTFPGPKHVSVVSVDRVSTDGSTDGDNKYMSRFIKHKNDSSQGVSMGLTLNAPQLLGHAVIRSVSFDSPQLRSLTVEAPPTFSGLPLSQISTSAELDDKIVIKKI